jgi:hypothetical protein
MSGRAPQRWTEMNEEITAIHHVTAIASDRQKNLDSYAGFLGCELK